MKKFNQNRVKKLIIEFKYPIDQIIKSFNMGFGFRMSYICKFERGIFRNTNKGYVNGYNNIDIGFHLNRPSITHIDMNEKDMTFILACKRCTVLRGGIYDKGTKGIKKY